MTDFLVLLIFLFVIYILYYFATSASREAKKRYLEEHQERARREAEDSK